jgi:molybdate transport system substrate-binding protein
MHEPDINRRATTLRLAGCGLAVWLAAAGLAQSTEVKVWTARAIATVLAEVGPEFERSSGHELAVASDLPAAFVKRAQAGEPFDLVTTGAAALDALIEDGRVIANSRADISRSGIGVAVRAGARKPDLGSVDAFKQRPLRRGPARETGHRPGRPGEGNTARHRHRLGAGRAVRPAPA